MLNMKAQFKANVKDFDSGNGNFVIPSTRTIALGLKPSGNSSCLGADKMTVALIPI